MRSVETRADRRLLSVLLFVYCALRELILALGRDQVLRLFFGMERA
jgi:hypothetical protein